MDGKIWLKIYLRLKYLMAELIRLELKVWKSKNQAIAFRVKLWRKHVGKIQSARVEISQSILASNTQSYNRNVMHSIKDYSVEVYAAQDVQVVTAAPWVRVFKRVCAQNLTTFHGQSGSFPAPTCILVLTKRNVGSGNEIVSWKIQELFKHLRTEQVTRTWNFQAV